MIGSTIHVQKDKGKLTKKRKIRHSVHTYPWIKIVQHQAFVKLDCYIIAECKTEP